MDDVYRPTGVNLPNVMTPGAWVIVAVVVAAILTGIGLVLYRVVKARVPWKQIPNYYPGSKWHSEASIDVVFLVKALQAAEQAFIEKTQWNAANMALVGHYVHVLVRSGESWLNLYGTKVAGESAGHTIIVGPSLAALGHEMGHLAELVLNRAVEDSHLNWPINGIAAAVEQYDQWLAKQRAADRLAAGVVAITPPFVLSGMSACRYRRPE